MNAHFIHFNKSSHQARSGGTHKEGIAELFGQADVVIRVVVGEKVMCDTIHLAKLKAVDAERCSLYNFVGRAWLWLFWFAPSSFLRIFGHGALTWVGKGFRQGS